MDEKTVERIAGYLKARPRADWERIAKESGVGYATVYRVGHGYTKNPRFHSVLRLQRWFESNAA